MFLFFILFILQTQLSYCCLHLFLFFMLLLILMLFNSAKCFEGHFTSSKISRKTLLMREATLCVFIVFENCLQTKHFNCVKTCEIVLNAFDIFTFRLLSFHPLCHITGELCLEKAIKVTLLSTNQNKQLNIFVLENHWAVSHLIWCFCSFSA